MKLQYKIIFAIVSILLIIAILNYSNMVYERLFGNEGSFVEYYNYDMPPEELLNKILKIKKYDKTLQFPNDTSLIGEIENGWAYVGFFDKENNKYFHTWLQTKNKFGDGTVLVFYGVSNTPNRADAKRINKDFGFLSKRIILQQFDVLVKNRIDEK